MADEFAESRAAGPRSLLKDSIAHAIRERIIHGVLRAGEQISDKELAVELAASRTPVREALLQLQSEGLVEVRPQRGTYVFSAGADEISEICVARGLFEADALRLCMANDPERLIVALGRLVAQAAIAVDKEELAAVEALDTQFHETLVGMSGNRYLIDSYSRISFKMRALRHRLPATRARMRQAVEQHRRILDLVSVGAADDAARAITEHVLNVRQLLTERLGTDQVAPVRAA